MSADPDDPARSRPGASALAPDDARLSAPSAERNGPAVVAALAGILAGRVGPVLEVGAGTGQHAVELAAALPGLRWHPTDPDPPHRASIDAWAAAARAEGRCAPEPARDLDARGDWATAIRAELGPLTAVWAANVIHIAPWPVAEGLVRNAAAALAPGGLLLLYGPFLDGDASTHGNRIFDARLRAQDPRWGVRERAEVAAFAAAHGFGPPQATPMPANNLILAFPRLTDDAGPATLAT